MHKFLLILITLSSFSVLANSRPLQVKSIRLKKDVQEWDTLIRHVKNSYCHVGNYNDNGIISAGSVFKVDKYFTKGHKDQGLTINGESRINLSNKDNMSLYVLCMTERGYLSQKRAIKHALKVSDVLKAYADVIEINPKAHN